MRQSEEVRDSILRFYERFSAGDAGGFADVLATGEGVSVIGSAPGEGHDERQAWIRSYERGMAGAAAGVRLEGVDPRGYEEGSMGWGVDTPAFVLPDGSRLPTRLTAIVHREAGDWKIVHLHFSVGVPDEQAIEPPP